MSNINAYNMSQSQRLKSISRSYSCHNPQAKPKRLTRSKTLDVYKGVTFSPNNTYHPIECARNTTPRRLLPNPVNVLKKLGQKYIKHKSNDYKESLISEFHSNENENSDNENEMTFNSPRGSFSGDGSNEPPENFVETYGAHFIDCCCDDKLFPSGNLSKNEIHYVSFNDKNPLAATVQKQTDEGPVAFQSIIDEAGPDMIDKPIEYSNYPLADYQRDQKVLKPTTKTITFDLKSDSDSCTECSKTPKHNKNPLDRQDTDKQADDDENSGRHVIFKKCSVDKTCKASSSFNSASIDSTEYGGYPAYRSMPRNARERDQDVREPIEPLDPHHDYHPHPNHHYNNHHHHREASVKRGQFTRSLSNTEPPPDEKIGKVPFGLDAAHFFESCVI